MIRRPEFQCWDKLKHATKRTAQAAKRSLKSMPTCLYPEALSVYRCPHCGFYHIGNDRSRIQQEVAE
jgi:rubrerythrin